MMSVFRMFAGLAAGVSVAAAAAQAQSMDAGHEPIEVMVLGTYHFTGGGADLHNADVDDHLSPQRQREIDAVVERLADFRPDRIMVELEPRHEAEFNADYHAWLDGERALTVNERQQLGMKLAARLGHDRLYAVDFQNGMDFEAMTAAAEAAGQDRLLAQFQQLNAEVPAMMAQFEQGSVRERLMAANAPMMDEMHRFYLVLAQMGASENPVGAQQMAAWWERNLVIFSRAAGHAAPGERIIVIYGAGHKTLLERFFDRAPGYELADPVAYLE